MPLLITAEWDHLTISHNRQSDLTYTPKTPSSFFKISHRVGKESVTSRSAWSGAAMKREWSASRLDCWAPFSPFLGPTKPRNSRKKTITYNATQDKYWPIPSCMILPERNGESLERRSTIVEQFWCIVGSVPFKCSPMTEINDGSETNRPFSVSLILSIISQVDFKNAWTTLVSETLMKFIFNAKPS
jgi:hypothetical protein